MASPSYALGLARHLRVYDDGLHTCMNISCMSLVRLLSASCMRPVRFPPPFSPSLRFCCARKSGDRACWRRPPSIGSQRNPPCDSVAFIARRLVRTHEPHRCKNVCVCVCGGSTPHCCSPPQAFDTLPLPQPSMSTQPLILLCLLPPICVWAPCTHTFLLSGNSA